MLRTLLFAFATFAAFAADSAWDKVRDLRTGTELRIFKKGARQPVLCTMDEANDERVVVVVKNEQVAIQKDDVDRIDFRPPSKSKHVKKETKTTETDSTQTTPVGPQPQGSRPGPSTSTSTTFGGGSKPDFETIYRKTAK